MHNRPVWPQRVSRSGRPQQHTHQPQGDGLCFDCIPHIIYVSYLASPDCKADQTSSYLVIAVGWGAAKNYFNSTVAYCCTIEQHQLTFGLCKADSGLCAIQNLACFSAQYVTILGGRTNITYKHMVTDTQVQPGNGRWVSYHWQPAMGCPPEISEWHWPA